MELRARLQDRANKMLYPKYPKFTVVDNYVPPWQVLKEKIDQLKLQGTNFDFAKHAPDAHKKEAENRNKKTWPKEKYHWPVMFFLFLFSFIVCSCCIIIMCWQKIDKFGDT